MNPAPLERRDRLTLVALFLAAMAIRIATANYPLWFDEVASTAFAREPLHNLWSGWIMRENNPPLYYTVLKGWIAITGDSDVGLRLLSVIIDGIGLILAWRITERLGGKAAGWLVVVLLALSVGDFEVGQEVRGYTLAFASTLAATWAAIDYLERRRNAALLVYALAALVALYCHTTMAVFVILVNIAMTMLLIRDRRALGRWLAANIVVAITWAWWIGVTLSELGRVRGSFGWISRPGPGAAVETTAQTYLPGYTLIPVGPVQVALLAAAMVGVACYVWRDRRPAVLLLACLALGAPLLLSAIRLVLPVFTFRTLGWAAVPWTILVALAISRIPTRIGKTALVMAILAIEVVVLIRWMPYRAKEDWPAALGVIANADQQPLVLVQGDAMALAADRYRSALPEKARIFVLPRPAAASDSWADGMARQQHINAADAMALLRQHGRLYTLRRGDSDPGAALRGIGAEQKLTDPPGDRQPYVSRWRAR